MHTLIELFDKDPVENIYTVVALRPEHVIYVGDRRLMNEESKHNINTFFLQKELSCTVEFIPVEADNVAHIRSVLETVLESHPDCVCDVTGGTDLLLVTVGMLCEEKRIPAVFFDIRSGALKRVGKDTGENYSPNTVKLTTENVMALAGGSFLRHGHYSPELETEETKSDILAVWDIIKKDITAWNRQSAFFQQTHIGTDELDVHAPVHIHVNFKNMVHCNPVMMAELQEAGIISRYRMENNRVHFRYKSLLLKALLSDTGIWLELYAYYTAINTGYFDDVQTSVIIDWDGAQTDPNATINEIDDILIKGITPLFISCKIGVPSVLALNEIDTLTRRFGGAFAKPVLVTASRIREIPLSTLERAKNMDLRILSVSDLSQQQFAQTLMRLADSSNTPLKFKRS